MEEFLNIIKEFTLHPIYKKMNNFIAHGKTTVLNHMINVAYLSYQYAKKSKKNYDIKSIVRGAMLHDFYLYDWHFKGHKRPHGFLHPKISYCNAKKYFSVNKIEKDIILKHMFPLIILPPRYKESWLVSRMDKKVSRLKMKNRKINYLIIQDSKNLI